MSEKPTGYAALFTVIVIGAVVTTIAASILLGGLGSLQSSRGVEGLSLSRSAANSCAELGLNAIQANTNLSVPYSNSAVLNAVTNQSCSYTVSGSSPNFTILSTGVAGISGQNFTRKVTVTTSSVSPQVTVSSWQDTP